MSTQKYLTEHFSRLKYTEIKNLPKTHPSRRLSPEPPPKHYLVMFTPNPVDSFERRLSHTGISANSRFDTSEHTDHVKRSGFGGSHQVHNAFGAQDSLKHHGGFGYVNDGFYENQRVFVEPPRINVNPPPPFEEFRGSSSLHGSKIREGRELVKRSGGPPRPVVSEEINLHVQQIEALEAEVKRLRELEVENKRLKESNRTLELENGKAKSLLVENQRLNETVMQYRSSITNFGELDRQNRELQEEIRIQQEEIQGLRHKIEDYEFHLADNRDLETRLQEEYDAKLRVELGRFDKMRRELEQFKGLEEKFYRIQAEKLSLEEEIEKIRVIKITLESQLEKFRISYEEIEEEVTQRVQREFDARLNEMGERLESMTRELREKETRMRANFDRELLEVNSVNRGLQEKLRDQEERVKRSGNSERATMDLREKLNAANQELERERRMKIDMEVKWRSVNEANFQLKQELESRGSISPEKERLLEQVALELDKVNKALRGTQEERDSLRRELAGMQGLREQNNGLNVKINELMRSLNGLREENQGLRANLGNRGEIETLNIKLGEANGIIQKQRGDIEALIQEREDLRMQHDRVKKGGLDARRGVEEENQSLKRELDILQIKCNDLVNKLKEYENLVGNLRLEIEGVEGLRRENGDLKFKLQESVKAMGMLRQDFEGLLREKEFLGGKLRELERTKDLGNAAENKRLIEQILQLSNELQAWKEKFSMLEASTRDQVEKAKRSQIMQVGREVQEAKAEAEAFRGQLRGKDQEINSLIVDLRRKDQELEGFRRRGGEIEDLRRELGRKDAELEGLRRRIGQAEDLRRELERKEQEVAFAKEHAEKAKRSHMNQATDEKNRVIGEIKAVHEKELRDLREELDRVRGELRRREEEIEGLRGEMRRKDMELEGLRVEVRKRANVPQFNINEADIRAKYEAQITSLEAKIMTIEVERDQLREKVESLLREVRQFKETTGQMEVTIQNLRGASNKSLEVLSVMRENEALKMKQLVIRGLNLRGVTKRKNRTQASSRFD